MKKLRLSILVSILIFCFVLPGCGKIIKRKIRRKLDVNVEVNHTGVQVQVLGFWADGCAPCRRAKIVLGNAKIDVQWIKADCYNRGMVEKYEITKVPTLIVRHQGNVILRTHDPEKVINAISLQFRGNGMWRLRL